MSEPDGLQQFEDFVQRQQALARNAERISEHMLAHPDHDPEILESGWLRCSQCGPEGGDLLEATISDEPDPHDHPAPGDPRYDGFRITEIWVVCAVDPTDNQEGVVAVEGPSGTHPLIASDRERLADLQRLMELRGLNQAGHRLKRFVLDDEQGLTP